MKTNKKEITVITVCPNCGRVSEVQVNEADYDGWVRGDMSTQEAFPYLCAEDREKLLTGYCEECWLDLFCYNDEEDEDYEDEYYAALFGEEDEDDYEDYDYSDYEDEDLDEGFDPYMGCYTGDC